MFLHIKLSEAKLELAGRTPLFNYGGQEILIQQLQDEVERLSKKYAGPSLTIDASLSINLSPYRSPTEDGQREKR